MLSSLAVPAGRTKSASGTWLSGSLHLPTLDAHPTHDAATGQTVQSFGWKNYLFAPHAFITRDHK